MLYIDLYNVNICLYYTLLYNVKYTYTNKKINIFYLFPMNNNRSQIIKNNLIIPSKKFIIIINMF